MSINNEILENDQDTWQKNNDLAIRLAAVFNELYFTNDGFTFNDVARRVRSEIEQYYPSECEFQDIIISF